MATVNNTPNFQGGGAVSFAPYMQQVTNVILRQQEIARQEEKEQNAKIDEVYDQVSKAVAKIDTAGIKPADYEEASRMYEKVRTPMVDALIARQQGDMPTYYKKLSEAQANSGEFQYFISESKAEVDRGKKLADRMSQDPKGYGKEFSTAYEEWANSPTRGLPPHLRAGSEVWNKRVNTSSVPDKINGMVNDLFKTSKKLDKVSTERVTAGGRGADVLLYEESVNKEAFVEMMSLRKSDPTFQTWVQEMYPGATYEEGVMTLADAFEQEGRFTRVDRGQALRDQAPRSSSGGSGGGVSVGEVAYNVPVRVAGQRVVASRAVPLTISNVAIPNLEAVDAETGRVVNLEEVKFETGASSGRISNLLDIPSLNNILGSGNNEVVEYQIEVRNPDYMPMMSEFSNEPSSYYKSYYIRRDLLPAGLSNAKEIRAAASKFDQSRGTTGQQQPTTRRALADDL